MFIYYFIPIWSPLWIYLGYDYVNVYWTNLLQISVYVCMYFCVDNLKDDQWRETACKNWSNRYCTYCTWVSHTWQSFTSDVIIVENIIYFDIDKEGSVWNQYNSNISQICSEVLCMTIAVFIEIYFIANLLLYMLCMSTNLLCTLAIRMCI